MNNSTRERRPDSGSGSEEGPVATVLERSPLLRSNAERYADSKPFAGFLIGVSAPLTPHTGLFVDVLAAGGATVLVTSEEGTTQTEVVTWLKDRPGVTPLARAGMSADELTETRREILSKEPDLIADDGAFLLSMLHEEFPEVATGVCGGCEQTTGGISKLKPIDREDALTVPVYDVNGTPMKRHFDNVHGTAESSLSAVLSLTNTMISGSVAVVVGYGYCGRGVARKLRALGARTIVTEVDPRKALEALADGHDVRPLREAVPEADLLLTATGRYRVFRDEHIEQLTDGTIVASIGSEIEIDEQSLAERATHIERQKPGVDQYLLPNGRRVTLLTGGRVVNLAAPDSTGNPSEVMDTTFSLMVRALEALADGVDLEPGLHPLPDRLDREVAHEKLAAMDVEIDEVSPDQHAYHEWENERY